MKQIALTKGFVALVDDEDYEWLSRWKWAATTKQNGHTYAQRGGYHNGKDVTVYMHRVIMGLKPGDKRQVDHVSVHETLNNQRANLRICTQQENMCNRAIRANNKSGFKGVSWDKRRSAWRAQIAKNGRTIYLGVYGDPEIAHNAYRKAAMVQHGEFSRTA